MFQRLAPVYHGLNPGLTVTYDAASAGVAGDGAGGLGWRTFLATTADVGTAAPGARPGIRDGNLRRKWGGGQSALSLSHPLFENAERFRPPPLCCLGFRVQAGTKAHPSGLPSLFTQTEPDFFLRRLSSGG